MITDEAENGTLILLPVHKLWVNVAKLILHMFAHCLLLKDKKCVTDRQTVGPTHRRRELHIRDGKKKELALRSGGTSLRCKGVTGNDA